MPLALVRVPPVWAPKKAPKLPLMLPVKMVELAPSARIEALPRSVTGPEKRLPPWFSRTTPRVSPPLPKICSGFENRLFVPMMLSAE